MAFENSNVPLGIFNDDGSMCLPNNKSDFMKKIEDLFPKQEGTFIPEGDCMIYDGHFIVQCLPFPPLSAGCTYRSLAQMFYQYTLNAAKTISNNSVNEIHIVFDRYISISVKSQTRAERGCTSGNEYFLSLNGDVSIRKDEFLKKSANKSSLASVYTKFIEESYETLGDKTLYLSRGSGDVGFKADCNGINQIDSLTSNQEEADTRMILHCIKAVNNGAKMLIIHSNDTDVLVLLIHHFPVINAEKIYLIVGVKGRHTDNTRSIAVHDIYRKLTPAQQAVILPVYCITGCDTISSFYGIGKRTVFKIFMKITREVSDMSELGEGYLSSSVVDACTYFVGVLYGNQSTSKLNSLRASLALKRSPKKIPPTDTSFRLHILQAAYQFSIWKQAPCGIQSQNDALIWNDAIVPLISTEACAVP